MTKCTGPATAVLVSFLLAIAMGSQAQVSVIHVFDGEAHPGGLGYPARDIGDFNGDSYADWAAYTDEGSVNVYFGGASPDTIPDLVLREHYFSIGYGSRLAGKCDFNGDGFDDIVLAAGRKAHVYLGGAAPDAEWDLRLTWDPEGSYVYLASAGDLNGDGYDDLVAADDSTAYVFLGGNPPDGNPDLTIAEGYQVAGIGDVNHDGYDDIAIGTHPTNVYLGSAVPDNVADVIVPSALVALDYPDAVSGAGDLNGDGFDDLAIGDPNYDNPGVSGSSDGMVLVCYGGSPMDAVADWTARGQTGSGQLGQSIAPAGDVNGDGFDDLLVGAPYHNTAYLFYGGAAPDTVPALSLVGAAADDRFSIAVAGLGDVNGDHKNDILVGPTSDGDYVRLYFGGPAMDAMADLVITDEEGHQLGYAVTEAGDLNGDTYGDWAIGVPFGLNRGTAYVYSGGTAGDMVRDVTLARGRGFGGELNRAGDVRNDGYDDLLVRYAVCGEYVYVFYGGSPMDSINDKRLSSDPSCGDAGTFAMAPAGDFNGDGYDDVLVGLTSFFGPGWTELYYGGAAFNNKPDVYFEAYECAGGGDVNGDHFADVITGNPTPWSGNGYAHVYLGGASVDTFPDPDYVLQGTTESFGMRVAFAGDLNGDGFDDIAVSSSSHEYENGDVYIYFGGPAMNETPDLVLASPGVGSGFGLTIEALGDLNSDGFEDLAVGAPWGGGYKGEAYIYFGGDPMDAEPDILLQGEHPEDRFGFSIAGIGDINGDGQVEFLVGAPGYSDNRGIAYMYAAPTAGVPDAQPPTKRLVITEVGPNPLSGHLTIKYSVGVSGIVQTDLFDVSGKLVSRLARESALPGDHVLEIDLARNGGRPIAPGVYFIRLSHGGESRAKKIVLAE